MDEYFDEFDNELADEYDLADSYDYYEDWDNLECGFDPYAGCYTDDC